MDAFIYKVRSCADKKIQKELESLTAELKTKVKPLIDEREKLEKCKKEWFTEFPEVESRIRGRRMSTSIININEVKTVDDLPNLPVAMIGELKPTVTPLPCRTRSSSSRLSAHSG